VAGKIASLAKTTNYKARQALKVAKDAPELLDEVAKGSLKLRDAVKHAAGVKAVANSSWNHDIELARILSWNREQIAKAPKDQRKRLRGEIKGGL
jgi:hypothetical protein